jgi:hypothetical protein
VIARPTSSGDQPHTASRYATIDRSIAANATLNTALNTGGATTATAIRGRR